MIYYGTSKTEIFRRIKTNISEICLKVEAIRDDTIAVRPDINNALERNANQKLFNWADKTKAELQIVQRWLEDI